MTRSMTGFGSAADEQMILEISSVNSRKGLELHCDLPGAMRAHEPALRSAIAKVVHRGQVHVAVRAGAAKTLPIAEDLAPLAKHWTCVAKQLEIDPASVTLSFLLEQWRFSSIVETTPIEPFLKLVGKALEAFDRSRAAEGRVLAQDLDQRLAQLQAILERVQVHVQGSEERLAEKLRKRLARLGISDPTLEERLWREIALAVDRWDVTEETVRLGAHLSSLRGLLHEPLGGRNGEFLLQEIHRELHTLSSKLNEEQSLRDALEMRGLAKQVGEQWQNIE